MQTEVVIQEKAIELLESIAKISIAFEVNQILSPTNLDTGIDGFNLQEKQVNTPYYKDYDSSPNNGPSHWSKQFDISNWGLIVAEYENHLIGSAVIAFDTKGLNMLKGRQDLAVLWDMRIMPEYRSCGIGTKLFQAVEKWAVAMNCTQLDVETQNINLPACRFYAKQGCVISELNRAAYLEFPDEIQLIWTKEIAH